MSTEFEPEINAITLTTTDMDLAVEFYSTCGMEVVFGGRQSDGKAARFTTLRWGRNFVNLTAHDGDRPGFWGRVVFHVASPDDLWRRLVDAGYAPSTEPSDASWGERYFHVLDPDGHELSFARRLES
ncbi:MAG: VOC family protein [Acidimicrobiales bacterium]